VPLTSAAFFSADLLSPAYAGETRVIRAKTISSLQNGISLSVYIIISPSGRHGKISANHKHQVIWLRRHCIATTDDHG
jgi:hypothetical protein